MRFERQPKTDRQVAAKRLVLIRLGAKAVVYMNKTGERCPDLRRQVPHQERQGHGICPARDGDRNPVARAEQTSPADPPHDACR